MANSIEPDQRPDSLASDLNLNELIFNEVSIYESYLCQNGILTYFANEKGIAVMCQVL